MRLNIFSHICWTCTVLLLQNVVTSLFLTQISLALLPACEPLASLWILNQGWRAKKGTFFLRDLPSLPPSPAWTSLLSAPQSSSRKLALTSVEEWQVRVVSLCRALGIPLFRTSWGPSWFLAYIPQPLPGSLFPTDVCCHREEEGHASTHLYKPSTSCLAVGNQLLPCCQDSALGIDESPPKLGQFSVLSRLWGPTEFLHLIMDSCSPTAHIL